MFGFLSFTVESPFFLGNQSFGDTRGCFFFIPPPLNLLRCVFARAYGYELDKLLCLGPPLVSSLLFIVLLHRTHMRPPSPQMSGLGLWLFRPVHFGFSFSNSIFFPLNNPVALGNAAPKSHGLETGCLHVDRNSSLFA